MMLGSFMYACTATFIVLFIRALPWPPAWLTKRPLGCDACCTGWLCILTAAPWFLGGHSAIQLGFVAGLTMLLLALHRKLADLWTPPT